MRRPEILLLMAVFALSSVSLSAQKLTSGSIDVLKGEKTLNVVFDYSNITVGNLANGVMWLIMLYLELFSL